MRAERDSITGMDAHAPAPRAEAAQARRGPGPGGRGHGSPKMKEIGYFVMGVIATVIAGWLSGFLNQFLPPPKQAWLALKKSPVGQSTTPRRQLPHRLVLVGERQ